MPPSLTPEPQSPPEIARPIPAPAGPLQPLKPSPRLTTGLSMVAGMVIALML